MDLRNTDLNLLPVFEALLRTQSVTGAGRLIGLSQPAMSYALARLREQFADPLFIRAGRVMLPTPRAQELAVPIAEVLDGLRRRVFANPTFDPALAGRAFTVCLTDVGGLVFLPALLKRLRELAPDTVLHSRQLPALELVAALETGEVDIAIGYFPDLPGSLMQQRLYERSYVCAFREAHPEIGNELTLKQYVALDHAVVRSPVRVHETVDRALARRRMSRRVVLSVPHYIVIPSILEQTDLVSTVPAEIGAVFARFARIRMVPLPVRVPNVVLRQYWHPRYQQDAANRWLRGLVSELFAEPRGGSPVRSANVLEAPAPANANAGRSAAVRPRSRA